MKEGWTYRGKYKDKDAIYRIEEAPEGFYLFVFTDGMKTLERDALADTLSLIKEVAFEDCSILPDNWEKEVWENSYS